VQFEIFTKQVHYVHVSECAIMYMMEGNLFTLCLYCTHTDANTACYLYSFPFMSPGA